MHCWHWQCLNLNLNFYNWKPRGLVNSLAHPIIKSIKEKIQLQTHCRHQEYLNPNPNFLKSKSKGPTLKLIHTVYHMLAFAPLLYHLWHVFCWHPLLLSLCIVFCSHCLLLASLLFWDPPSIVCNHLQPLPSMEYEHNFRHHVCFLYPLQYDFGGWEWCIGVRNYFSGAGGFWCPTTQRIIIWGFNYNYKIIKKWRHTLWNAKRFYCVLMVFERQQSTWLNLSIKIAAI